MRAGAYGLPGISVFGAADSDQVRKASATEFFHNARLVNFDSARTDPELCGDVEVLLTCRQWRKNFPFSGRQAGQALRHRGTLSGRDTLFAVDAQRILHN